MNDHVKWLTTCPVSDINFKNHLEAASAEEVREALKIIEGHLYVKTKEKALRAALKRKEAGRDGEIPSYIQMPSLRDTAML